jgi:hypothetical protein
MPAHHSHMNHWCFPDRAARLWQPILVWLSTLLYRPMLRRCAEHPLALLNQHYDPTPVVAACAAFHHAPGTCGAPPTFSIDLFVRAEIVRAWADSCSDPFLEELLTTNFLVRWFVGLPLTQPAPTIAPWPTFTPS